MGQFQNSVDGGGPAEKTKHREDHQDYDKHDGPHKDPLACKISCISASRMAWPVSFCLLGLVTPIVARARLISVSEFETDPLPIFLAVTPAGQPEMRM
jgi:hypothetical protein